MKVAVILNPKALRSRFGFFTERKIKKALNFPAKIFSTESEDELKEALREVQDFEILCVIGGDGSQRLVISELYRIGDKMPFIVPVKGGTMNMLHKNVYPGQTPMKALVALRNFLSTHSNVPAKMVKTLRAISLESNALDKPELCFFFGWGALQKILARYYEAGGGLINALSVTTRAIFGYAAGDRWARSIATPTKCKVIIDGEEYPYGTALMSVASSYKKLVLFFSPYVEPEPKDGFFFGIISELPSKVFKNIVGISTGKILLEKEFNGVARCVEMEFEGGFIIDGELVPPRANGVKVKLSVGPEIRFLVPG